MYIEIVLCLLRQCRFALSRHRGIRALWVLTVLGMLFASVPRWELHQHSVVDQDHEHAGSAHDHHRDVVAYTDDEGDLAVAHFHASPAFSVAFIQASLPSLDRLSSSADAFAPPELTPVVSCWPPPHRPPIA